MLTDALAAVAVLQPTAWHPELLATVIHALSPADTWPLFDVAPEPADPAAVQSLLGRDSLLESSSPASGCVTLQSVPYRVVRGAVNTTIRY